MTLAKLERKVNDLIKEYTAKGYSMIDEPHKRVCSELFAMTTYSMGTAEGKRIHIVATLWYASYFLDEWSISVYDPKAGKKPIFHICGE